MKIGTDGVLLGAWVSLDHKPNSILDIGAGTGIIALQLAQRSTANVIDAIEIEENAFEQAVANFENSKWRDRLFCYHTSLQEFSNEVNEQFDLIVSNPPFYNDTFESNSSARNLARFVSSLTFEELLKAVVKLLSTNGTFALVIPNKEEDNFLKLAKRQELYPRRICHVKGTPNSKIKRSMIEFSFVNQGCEVEQLIIETTRHHYTTEYTRLVKDFYLKM